MHSLLPRRLVIRLLTATLALWSQAAVAAQQGAAASTREPQNARPFLWRIDGKVPSYLFGTIHLPDERVTDVNPEVERALAASDAVFTELEMDMVMSPELMQAMRMPAGKTLRDVADDELVQRVLRRLGIDGSAATAVLSVRPWVLSMQVLMQGHATGGDALDMQIYKDAKSAGKQVGGLETIAEQLAAFDSLGLEGEVALLKLTLDLLDDYERRGLDLCEQMILAYCEGDSPKMLKFFDEMNHDADLWGRMSRALLTDRNLRMAERIDRMLHAEPERRFTFAVGTGHLIGEVDVVELLRARGYTVTRVPESLANLDEELEELQLEVARRQERIRELQARRAALAAPRQKAG